MRTDSWWIQAVDHRVSTALIFLLLIFLLGNERRRKAFVLRFVGTGLVLCLTSWVLRFWIDASSFGTVGSGLGHAFHILCMSLLFLAGYVFCYETPLFPACYVAMVGVVIYKLSWNTFKAFGYAIHVSGHVGPWSQYSVLGALVSYGVYALVCFLSCAFYRVMVKAVPFEGENRSMGVLWLWFLGIQLALEYCGFVFTGSTEALFLYYFCALLYTFLNFIVLVVIAQLALYRRDNEQMQSFIRNKMQYYQMSHDGIASLQVKCHDLKHQIAAIRSQAGKVLFEENLSRLEDTILEYGTVVECGNESINIVLTEKNILCSTMGVKFSYMVDGHLFDFLSEMEIYSLFGNALDNALEGCSRVKDPEKRVISLKASLRGDMVILHVENSYEEEFLMGDALPKTTKEGTGHGFGLRSMQEIARKYEGIFSVKGENQIFKLTVGLKKPTA